MVFAERGSDALFVDDVALDGKDLAWGNSWLISSALARAASGEMSQIATSAPARAKVAGDLAANGTAGAGGHGLLAVEVER